jgi:hypothetical protein
MHMLQVKGIEPETFAMINQVFTFALYHQLRSTLLSFLI